eukprot:190451-Chlamydomonas_euryale.AAC.1
MIINYGSEVRRDLCPDVRVLLEFTYQTILTMAYLPISCRTSGFLQTIAVIEFTNSTFSEKMVYAFYQ